MRFVKFILLLFLFSSCKKDIAPTTYTSGWRQVNCFLAGRYEGLGFSIEDKGYFGTGVCNSVPLSDFWEFNPSTNSWNQKANFPAGEITDGIGFSIGNKGYVGLGEAFNSSGVNMQLWEFDPTNNIWTRKADFPSCDRMNAVAFSIGGKGYVGTGYSYSCSSHVFNDFWEYDPSADQWNQKASYPGGLVESAIGFAIGNKGYIGTGNNLNSFNNNFYEYDPSIDVWTKKANFIGKRIGATGLSLNGNGYLICGNDSVEDKNDLWEYNPIANTWVQQESLPYVPPSNTAMSLGLGRRYAIGFVVGNTIYFGDGFNTDWREVPDWWSYRKQ